MFNRKVKKERMRKKRPMDVTKHACIEASFWPGSMTNPAGFTLSRVVNYRGHHSVSKTFYAEDVVNMIPLMQKVALWYAFDPRMNRELRRSMNAVAEVLAQAEASLCGGTADGVVRKAC